MTTFKPLLFLLGAVLVIGLLGSLPYFNSNQKTGISTTYSSCTSKVSTTISNNSTLINAKSFNYTSDLVKVESVAASLYKSRTEERVVFQVKFINSVNTTLYVPSVCGGSLSVTKVNSSLITLEKREPVCLCAMYILPLQPGLEHISVTPGCWSGYVALLKGHGTAYLTMELKLYKDSNLTEVSSTFINAIFSF
jgi:hypothetical protein